MGQLTLDQWSNSSRVVFETEITERHVEIGIYSTCICHPEDGSTSTCRSPDEVRDSNFINPILDSYKNMHSRVAGGHI